MMTILRSFINHFKEAFQGLWRNSLMTTASTASIFFAMLLLGVVTLVGLNVRYIATGFAEEVEMAVFIEDAASQDNIDVLYTEVEHIANVTGVEYISKSEALEIMIGRLGEENRELMLTFEGEDNPLPRFLRVMVDDPEALGRIAEKIGSMDWVEKVSYSEGEAKSLSSISKAVTGVGYALMALFAVAGIFIVSNTIKLTVFARRKEINIMQLVGARNSYIAMPFMIQGFLIGFMGSRFAMSLCYLCYRYILSQWNASLQVLELMPIGVQVLQLVLGGILCGVVIGGLGSLLSLRRFLRE